MSSLFCLWRKDDMPPIVSFIGWHNSGKTTLAGQVVTHLKQRGYSIAVIKSSKETDIPFDKPGTDTSVYRKAGADCVSLVAPDQMVLMTPAPELNLVALAHRYFADMDIVIAEGFKYASRVPKIEVTRGESELLRNKVKGVIATATDRSISGDYIFRLDESAELADFIEKRFLDGHEHAPDPAVLMINGKKIVLKKFVQENLAGTVVGFIRTLKIAEPIDEIELRIRVAPPKK